MTIEKGIIRGFKGSGDSAIGFLILETEHGIKEIPCENAAIVRAMECAFGDVIGPGYTVNSKGGHIGQEVFYSTDGFFLDGFTPIKEAHPALVEAYQKKGRFN